MLKTCTILNGKHSQFWEHLKIPLASKSEATP